MQPSKPASEIPSGDEHMRPEVLDRINRDKRLAKWTHWLRDHIGPEVHSLHVNREVWQGTQEIISRNQSLPQSYWWQFLADTYTVMVAVALRRLVEAKSGVITLGRLVLEMSRTPTHITLEYYLTRYGTDDTRLAWARQHWADEFAGEVGDHLDPRIPAADLARMTEAVAPVKALVDRHLAHRDQRAIPADAVPTLGDAHAAIDVIGEVYRRYMCLTNGLESAVLLPRFDHDWQAVFRQPWA